jgi:hypothetical protein
VKNNQLYKFGIRGLCLVVFFRLVLLMYLYYKLRAVINLYGLPIKIFNWLEIAGLILLIIEALVYAWLQTKVKTKLWVHLQIWSLAFALFIMPLILMGALFLMLFLNLDDSKETAKTINWIRFYLTWGCTIAGHIAFIVVLVKSLKKKDKAAPQEAPGGILDEFTTE